MITRERLNQNLVVKEEARPSRSLMRVHPSMFTDTHEEKDAYRCFTSSISRNVSANTETEASNSGVIEIHVVIVR